MNSTVRDTEALLSRAETADADADADIHSSGSDTGKDSLDDAVDFNDDLSDSDSKPLHRSLHERKALLVTRELDEQGMGRYQWMVFFLCGFGYLLDLLWAQAFGLVVTPMQREFGFDDTQLGNIFTAFSIGLTAGALVWGVLVDLPAVGRKAAFNYTVLMSTAFGICLGIPDSYGVVVVLTAFTGIHVSRALGRGGHILLNNIVQDSVLAGIFPSTRQFVSNVSLRIVIGSSLLYRYSNPWGSSSAVALHMFSSQLIPARRT